MTSTAMTTAAIAATADQLFLLQLNAGLHDRTPHPTPFGTTTTGDENDHEQ